MSKPYSQACENNQVPILRAIRRPFGSCRRVLELASGSGQHGVFFASQLPQIEWQPTDLPQALEGIRAWQVEADLSNLAPPLALDVSDQVWPGFSVDGVFAANLLHYVSWPAVVNLFHKVGSILAEGNPLCIYGPFNYNGNFTSASNQRFDDWLKSTDQERGIRDFESVDKLAQDNGLTLVSDQSMPANNRLLWWRKRS